MPVKPTGAGMESTTRTLLVPSAVAMETVPGIGAPGFLTVLIRGKVK